MDNYEQLYKQLTDEFHSYQEFVEGRLQRLSQNNKDLERKLSNFVNIVEVSKYINSNMSDVNLLSMINDMIVGMFGVSYSTIHLIEGSILVPKVTNIGELEDRKIHYTLEELSSEKAFIKNSNTGIFKDSSYGRVNSLIGVPVFIKEKLIGYIVVEHIYYTFFQKEDVTFINYISHQVAIAIENSKLYKKVQDASRKDALIDIYNRTYFYDYLYQHVRENEKDEFAIIMADIDNFKKVNDTYGHQNGDIVIKGIVDKIRKRLDDTDVLARYGGEEIILFVNNFKDKNYVINKIDEIRKAIADMKIDIKMKDIDSINVTVSFGVAFSSNYIKTSDEQFIENIIKKADECLYSAKREGKNRVKY
ncbi:MAG: sensor domain-containing diguanylate cyclase [Sarcina sp.]